MASFDGDTTPYQKEIESLSAAELIELANADSPEKPYDDASIKARTTLLFNYYKNWIIYIQLSSIADTISLDLKLPPNTSRSLLSLLETSYRAIRDPNYILRQYYRIQAIIHITNNIIPNSYVRSSCVVFSAKRNGVSLSTNYAYLYTQLVTPEVNSCPSFQHQFICIGPNLQSSDGEYRPHFTTYSTISLVKSSYPYIWKALDDYLIPRPSTKFYQHYYCPLSTDTPPRDYTEDVRLQIKNERLSVDLFILAWFSHAFLTHLGLQYRSLDSNFAVNITTADDDLFIAELIAAFTLPSLKMLYSDSGSLPAISHIARARPSCGQKIIYMSHESLVNVMNIEYRQWLEIYVAKKVTDLLLNNVCPGISLTTNWFPVYQVDKWIFNNADAIDVMQHHAGSANRTVGGETTDSVSNAVLIISEYAGRTINEIPSLVKSDDYLTSVGNIFEDYVTFSKYLFDVTYALLCINVKFGFIHGDLHLNNVTIHQMLAPHAKTKDRCSTLYVVDGVAYGFASGIANPATATLIDFGRAIISRSAAASIDIIGDPSIIEDNQHARVLSYYETTFPEFYQLHSDALASAMERDFDSVFRVFTAVDIYTHTTSLLRLMQNKTELNPDARVIALAAKMRGVATTYLTEEMSALLRASASNATPSAMSAVATYPNHYIIAKCFGEYVLDTAGFKSIDTVLDIFLFDGELKYTLGKDYDRLPPRFKYRKLMKNRTDQPAEIPHGFVNVHKQCNDYNLGAIYTASLIRTGIVG